jgi:hypothetical protein
MFLPRMFLVHLGWLLRVIFPVAFSAKSEQERGDNEGDDPSFLRREDKAIAQSFKPRAPDWFQLSDKSLRASPRAPQSIISHEVRNITHACNKWDKR